MAKTNGFRLDSLLFAILGLVCGSRALAETIILRSGFGADPVFDARVRMLPGPSNGEGVMASVFSQEDFNAAREGPFAYKIPRNVSWHARLDGDYESSWINTWSSASSGGNALYAIDFEVTQPGFERATLVLHYMADNQIGGNSRAGASYDPNAALYLDEVEIYDTQLDGCRGEFGFDHEVVLDITDRLSPGPHTLYIHTYDCGVISGLIFRAEITTCCDIDGDGWMTLLDCDDQDACSHPGAPEQCDGKDNDCDGTPDDGPPLAPGPTPGLGFASGKTTLTWSRCGVTTNTYDVVKGSLNLLRSTGGGFASSLTGCLENNSTDLMASDLDTPTPGNGLFYLVRTNSPCGPGTYDGGVAAQVGGRDAEIALSSWACPP